MRTTTVGLFLLALLVAAPAFAEPEAVPAPSTEARTPNFLGATGLLLAPSAYVQGNGDVTLFAHGGGGNDFAGGGAVGGILNRLEVGFTVASFRGDIDFLANAKLNLLRESRSLPAISIGVIDAFDQLDVDPSAYVVASKYFTRGDTNQRFSLKGHVGFGSGVYDLEPFAGAELFFDRHLSAMAEFVNDDFNIGARYNYRGFHATIGLFDFSHIGGGLGYTMRFR